MKSIEMYSQHRKLSPEEVRDHPVAIQQGKTVWSAETSEVYKALMEQSLERLECYSCFSLLYTASSTKFGTAFNPCVKFETFSTIFFQSFGFFLLVTDYVFVSFYNLTDTNIFNHYYIP